jgi:hypothetical protein
MNDKIESQIVENCEKPEILHYLKAKKLTVGFVDTY